MGRPRPDFGTVRRRGPHPAGGHARSHPPPRRFRAVWTRARSSFTHEMSVHAHSRRSARHAALHRRAMAAHRGARAARSIARSVAGDIRLTMGGEPTFVSIDDMDGAEWNTAALGPEKRLLAETPAGSPARRVRSRRPAALRAGQMVSGRAAAALGLRLLLAHRRRADVARSRAAGARRDRHTSSARWSAQRFRGDAGAPAGRRSRTTSIPAFEDPFYYLQRSGSCRSTSIRWTTPGRSDGARALRRVFERGLETPSAIVLPLQRGAGTDGPEWQTGCGCCAGSTLFLVPGDSPVGLRLPLPSLPWVAPSDAPQLHPRRSDGESRPLPVPPRDARRCRSVQLAEREADGTRSQARGRANPRHGSCARRCAWSRATGGCTSSCRR